jgi:hypothetical protein
MALAVEIEPLARSIWLLAGNLFRGVRYMAEYVWARAMDRARLGLQGQTAVIPGRYAENVCGMSQSKTHTRAAATPFDCPKR